MAKATYTFTGDGTIPITVTPAGRNFGIRIGFIATAGSAGGGALTLQASGDGVNLVQVSTTTNSSLTLGAPSYGQFYLSNDLTYYLKLTGSTAPSLFVTVSQ